MGCNRLVWADAVDDDCDRTPHGTLQQSCGFGMCRQRSRSPTDSRSSSDETHVDSSAGADDGAAVNAGTSAPANSGLRNRMGNAPPAPILQQTEANQQGAVNCYYYLDNGVLWCIPYHNNWTSPSPASASPASTVGQNPTSPPRFRGQRPRRDNNYNGTAKGWYPPRGSAQKRNAKYECKFIIGIEAKNAFQVKGRICGRGGRNMKSIVDECDECDECGEGTRLRVRGRGSGFKEGDGTGKKESDEPLYLWVCAPNPVAYEKAKQRVQKLLEEIYADYHKFTGYVEPKLEINLHEL